MNDAKRDAKIIREYQRLRRSMSGSWVHQRTDVRFWNRLGMRLGVDHVTAYEEATRVCRERREGTSPSLDVTDKKRRKNLRKAAAGRGNKSKDR